MITCARRRHGACLRQYSLAQPLPIVADRADAERAIERPSLFRRGPALGVVAQVGTPTRHSAGITDDVALNDADPDQLGLGLDLPAPNAASKRLSAQSFLPPPLAGEGRGGG